MRLSFSVVSLVSLLAACGTAGYAVAQEVQASHLQAARKAIAAIRASDQFDAFLPNTVLGLKDELTRRDLHLEKIISKMVDEQALRLAPRRKDLEKEIARVYSKHFTESELGDITKFYSSPVGKKLLEKGPEAMSDSVAAYDIWRQGIAQDLVDNVNQALNKKNSVDAPEKNGKH